MSINIGGDILLSTGFTTNGEILTPNIVTSDLVLWLDMGYLASWNPIYIMFTSYYDCGYGCQYYASDPGCFNCSDSIYDMSGNGYDGKRVLTSTVLGGGGGVATGMWDNQYITITGGTTSGAALPDSFWNAGSWTLSVVVYISSVNRGADNAFVGHGSATTNNGLHLCERSGYLYFGFYSNDTSGTIPVSGGWNNAVFTFNYSTKVKQIYLNGVYDTSGGTVGYGGTGTNTMLGTYPWSMSASFRGNYGGVIGYNRVLTADEIRQNYTAIRQAYNTL